MARSFDGSRALLRDAALTLFMERGYDQTTAAEIAARAGVTERTFFRHFPDKREVLFDGEARIGTALLASMDDALPGLAPLPTLLRAFRSLAPMLEGNRSYLQARHALIAATPVLHERELAKIAAQTDALAGALEKRGVKRTRAALAARVGMAANVHATLAWLADPEGGVAARIDLAFQEVKSLLAEEPGQNDEEIGR